jgi:hypothetical protein
MKPTPVITRHAIERYQQRVDPHASVREAAVALSRIMDKAAVCSRPRRWSRVIAQAPGTRYLYSADRPGVCLVVAGGAVVTVHSRVVCAAWRHLVQAEGQYRPSHHPRQESPVEVGRADAA